MSLLQIIDDLKNPATSLAASHKAKAQKPASEEERILLEEAIENMAQPSTFLGGTTHPTPPGLVETLLREK